MLSPLIFNKGVSVISSIQMPWNNSLALKFSSAALGCFLGWLVQAVSIDMNANNVQSLFIYESWLILKRVCKSTTNNAY